MTIADNAAAPAVPRPSSLVKGMISVIGVYQGIRAGKPSPCRFVPSCSSYATEALQRHGAVRGSWMALRRVGRCHPFGSQGIDPVPG